MKKSIALIVVLVALVLSSCGSDTEPVITLNTRFGEVKLVLFNGTPLHKKNFLNLAKSGDYDSTTFHRIIKGFMIQGGDLRDKGMEEPDLIPAEFNRNLIHERGAVAAARQGNDINPEKKSSGSQFYIIDGRKFSETELTVDIRKLNQLFGQMTRLDKYRELYDETLDLQRAQKFAELQQKTLEYKEVCEKEFGVELDIEVSPNRMEAYTTKGGAPHLDGGYTVFGMVIHGMEVVDQIANQPTGAANIPTNEILMTVEVEEMAKRDITLRYGYSFPD